MKTILLTVLGLMFAFASDAQNWEILNANKTYFYRHSDSLHIGNTIHTDSSFVDGTSETFYTAYKYKECDTCTVYPDGLNENSTTLIYRYATEFLGYDVMLDNENDNYLLDNKILRHHAELGETWDFSTEISATVTSLGQEELIGEMDSVKTIVLSTNDTIILSQNKGLIRYPDFENEGKYYELGGYHEGQNSYGEYAPNFWRIYDFEVGDSYCLYSFYSDGNYWGWNETNYQFSVLENLNGNNLISYKVHLLKENIYPGEFEYMYDYQNSIDTLSINYTDYLVENFYGIGKGIFQGENSVFYSNPLNANLSLYYSGVNAVDPEAVITASRINYSEEYGIVNTIRVFHPFNDNLLFTSYTDRHTSFANHMGRIADVDHGFEWLHEDFLSGAVISGDTIGNFCDFPFDLGIESHSINPLSIHPNPATDQITIGGNYNALEIYSQTGQLVMKVEEPKSIIDVSKLPSGIYFLKATSEEKLYATKLIIE